MARPAAGRLAAPGNGRELIGPGAAPGTAAQAGVKYSPPPTHHPGRVAPKSARLAHDLSQKCHETARRLCQVCLATPRSGRRPAGHVSAGAQTPEQSWGSPGWYPPTRVVPVCVRLAGPPMRALRAWGVTPGCPRRARFDRSLWALRPGRVTQRGLRVRVLGSHISTRRCCGFRAPARATAYALRPTTSPSCARPHADACASMMRALRVRETRLGCVCSADTLRQVALGSTRGHKPLRALRTRRQRCLALGDTPANARSGPGNMPPRGSRDCARRPPPRARLFPSRCGLRAPARHPARSAQATRRCGTAPRATRRHTLGSFLAGAGLRAGAWGWTRCRLDRSGRSAPPPHPPGCSEGAGVAPFRSGSSTSCAGASRAGRSSSRLPNRLGSTVLFGSSRSSAREICRDRVGHRRVAIADRGVIASVRAHERLESLRQAVTAAHPGLAIPAWRGVDAALASPKRGSPPAQLCALPDCHRGQSTGRPLRATPHNAVRDRGMSPPGAGRPAATNPPRSAAARPARLPSLGSTRRPTGNSGPRGDAGASKSGRGSAAFARLDPPQVPGRTVRGEADRGTAVPDRSVPSGANRSRSIRGNADHGTAVLSTTVRGNANRAGASRGRAGHSSLLISSGASRPTCAMPESTPAESATPESVVITPKWGGRARSR